MSDQFDTYIRMPFTIEALQITEENIESVASLVGTLKKNPEGVPYIEADRGKVPNSYDVKLGYWITRMGGRIRCYSSGTFQNQFVRETNDVSYHLAFIEQAGRDVLNDVIPEGMIVEDLVTPDGIVRNVFDEPNVTEQFDNSGH